MSIVVQNMTIITHSHWFKTNALVKRSAGPYNKHPIKFDMMVNWNCLIRIKIHAHFIRINVKIVCLNFDVNRTALICYRTEFSLMCLWFLVKLTTTAFVLFISFWQMFTHYENLFRKIEKIHPNNWVGSKYEKRWKKGP